MKENHHQFLSFGRIRHLHFVGIGGAGMCGIAEVLLNLGYQISGSDLTENQSVNRLKQLGANITLGHHKEAINGADVLVKSTAIKSDNPELVAAQEQRIPIVARAEMLAELMRFCYGIAIAGTHGKTTTTSLVSTILAHSGLDPTFVIGGCLNSAGTNARLGASRYFVAEADESDASFLYLKPMMAIVTNIDADHMSTYGNDFSRLTDTFIQFIHHLPFYGLAILCLEDPVIKQLLPRISRPMLTYGFSDEADLQAINYQQQYTKSHFTVKRKGYKSLDITLNIPGRHNVLNALAAIGVATELGISDQAIQQSLNQFSGIGRRFQIYDNLQSPSGEVLLVDDYGHHPRELESTIACARSVWPTRRLVMAFQPHRYTRTKDLLNEFADVLTQVDHLALLPVYSAGETAIKNADSQALHDLICQKSSLKPLLIKDNQDFQQQLVSILQPNDILLIQGAGSIGAMALQLVNQWKRK